MKLLRIEDAAERLGLSIKLLQLLEEEGRIKASDKMNGVTYFSQASLDHTMHELLCSVQKASWNDMELRMEAVEAKVEEIEALLRDRKDSRVL
ncbi:MAG: hypothetical protein AAF581_01385 [Planctomycetota bacterium]